MTDISDFIDDGTSLRILEDDLRRPVPPLPPNARAVISKVAADFGVPVALIVGRTRINRVVAARQEAMRRLHKLDLYSFPQIGRWFGRHHATVMHAIRGSKRAACNPLPLPPSPKKQPPKAQVKITAPPKKRIKIPDSPTDNWPVACLLHLWDLKQSGYPYAFGEPGRAGGRPLP